MTDPPHERWPPAISLLFAIVSSITIWGVMLWIIDSLFGRTND